MQKDRVSSLQTRNGLRFYQAAHLEATEHVIHTFSTRQGGVSPPPYHSLNLSLNTGDERVHVRKNREILTRAFGLLSSVLLTVNQNHGDDILIVDSSSPEDLSETSCDAMITDRPGIAIGVLTADCVPVLLFDPDRRAVAAIHVGWKGTASDLPGKTVTTMEEQFKTRPETLLAAVGPSIGSCCYEVDGPVHSTFSRLHDRWPKWARAVTPLHWMLNLSQANVDLLVDAGVRRENIVRINICTSCQEDLFYSHRRDGRNTGRQISFIMLKG